MVQFYGDFLYVVAWFQLVVNPVTTFGYNVK